MRPETEVLHRGEGAREGATPLNTPIYATTTFVFANAAELEAFQQGKSNKYLYTRYANPTVQAVEEKLAVLEGAEAALVTSSGMAATSTAFFGLLQAGDEVICSAAIYGGTLHVIMEFLERFGVTSRFASLDELAKPDCLIGPKTKVVWFESPINPTLRCVDIARVAAACRAKGVMSAIDNTFASPVNQQPLALGIDLVMHSATKYLNGHTDVTAGALVGSRKLIDALQPARKLFGGVLEPASAYALARGMKTLSLRVARQNASAHRVAEWLAQRPARRARVLSGPRVASGPRDRQEADAGFGGMVCVRSRGRLRRRVPVLRSPGRSSSAPPASAASRASAACRCSRRSTASTTTQLAAAGVTRGMVRLSIGLEDAEDLIADLDQALA